MPLPSQTFSTIAELLTYINTYVIPNGNEEISGEIENNVENAVCNFIVSYTLNSGLAKIESSGGDIVLSKPITVIQTTVPDTLQWPDNVQNEFYIVNATGTNIPLAPGFTYYDQNLSARTTIPARFVVHIAKADNAQWIQVNNIASSSILPPQTGHPGEFLTSDGSNSSWTDPVLYIKSADFDLDGITYSDTDLVNNKFDLFFDTLGNFIYEEDGQWSYESTGGFKILIPGIDANTQDLKFHLFKRGLNSNN